MMWVFLILAAIIAIPLVQEITRTTVTSVQPSAPGDLAPLDKGRLHYQWFGPKGGPVLVCLHGLTTSSYVWEGMLQGFALMGYRVLTFDHYGRGYSDRPSGAQDAAFYIDEVDALLAHEGVDGPVSLIGYSMGGAVAAVYASARPERVDRVILLASAGMQAPPAGIAGFIRRVPVLGDWLMLALYPWILRAGIRAERDLPKQVPGIAEKQDAELDLRGFVPAVLSSLRGILSAPLEAEHRTIAGAGIPVHAIWGEDDPLISLQCVDTLAEWNPDAVQHIIEGGTHAIPYANAPELLELIRAQAT